MQMETLKKLKFQKIFMITTILVNIVLDVLMAIEVQRCKDEKCQIKLMEFGLFDAGNAYYTLLWLLFSMYMLMLFIFIPVVFKIMKMFKHAYPELYDQVALKLIIFLLLYELFIGIRAVTYWYTEINGINEDLTVDGT